ncbi:T9SS type A sorting domain-containing protein [Flavobacteriaceae bacterium Ap0902]|nr:T9SS type A sorting domain-containing protein [Flavobacteriaceae bacterium Ap0902]
MKLKFTFLSSLFSLILWAQSAPSYYDDLDFSKTGVEMKIQLRDLMIYSHHHVTTYNELRDLLPESDADPDVNGNILLIYGSQATGMHQRSRSADGSWNREHVYPKSLGNPNLGNSGPGADAHHIRPADKQLNSLRENLPFVDGTGAMAGKSNGGFYPGEEWKGDVARILMYLHLHYGERTNPSRVVISPYTWSSDIPDLLLKWNAEDPVSDFERQRNDVVAAWQGNRNPFVDNPYLATIIWTGPEAENTWPDSIDGGGDGDTEVPTVPTNLELVSSTSTTLTFSWDASQDNVAVTSYAVYIDSEYHSSVNTNTATVSGLHPNTSYELQVKAIDNANNQSDLSEVLIGKTLEAGDGQTSCGTEDFENLDATENVPDSSYADRVWTNNGITWTATNARIDLEIEDGKALVMRGGNLSSTTLSGGIGSLSVQTQLKFSGQSGVYKLMVNGEEKGEIPYSSTAETFAIENINIAGDVIITLVDEVSNNRVAFDNLTWTCYSTMDVDNVVVGEKEILAYPNPVNNQVLQLKGFEDNQTVTIYNMNGQLVQTILNVQNEQPIRLNNLPSGVYILQVENKSIKIIVK